MENHNEYLKQVENYLQDLSVMERAKILSEINTDIAETSVENLESPLVLANKKRAEGGFIPYYEKKKFSALRFLTKAFSVILISFFILIGVLIWKFTPILKIDEEKNKVVILGGLIDIDGKAGRVTVFDETHYTQDRYTNDLKANFTLDPQRDEIMVKFNSGQFTLANAQGQELSLNCRLSSPAVDNMINNSQRDLVEIDFSKIDGATCKLLIPEDKKLTLIGEHSAINILNPEFNLYIELESGAVSFTPALEREYRYSMEVEDGYIGDFNSSDSDDAFEVRINIGKGSIITK